MNSFNHKNAMCSIVSNYTVVKFILLSIFDKITKTFNTDYSHHWIFALSFNLQLGKGGKKAAVAGGAAASGGAVQNGGVKAAPAPQAADPKAQQEAAMYKQEAAQSKRRAEESEAKLVRCVSSLCRLDAHFCF